MASDLLFEALTLWLVLSGVVWLVLAAFRLRTHGIDAGGVLMVAAALTGWLSLVRLTTSVLGDEMVPIDLGELPRSGLALYSVLAGLLVGALAAKSLASRSTTALAALLVLSTGAPIVVLPALFDDPLPQGVASPAELSAPDQDHPGMVYVREGPFIMGSLSRAQLRDPVGDLDGDEQPVRSVFLDGFYIDRTEVTNRDFQRFVSATGYVTDAERRGAGAVWIAQGWIDQPGASWRQPIGPGDSIVGLEDHPVVQVSWNDATAFCAWSGKRLPSEAEWEKAARGTDGRDYAWGADFDAGRVNYCDRDCTHLPQHKDDSASDGFARTAPVGSFPGGASPYGALDMVGNVWEWVGDWYDPNYYSYAPDVNPPGPRRGRNGVPGGSRVVRGGSFASERDFTRTTSRSYDPPEGSYFGVGLRCAADG